MVPDMGLFSLLANPDPDFFNREAYVELLEVERVPFNCDKVFMVNEL